MILPTACIASKCWGPEKKVAFSWMFLGRFDVFKNLQRTKLVCMIYMISICIYGFETNHRIVYNII